MVLSGELNPGDRVVVDAVEGRIRMRAEPSKADGPVPVVAGSDSSR
jgi:hypothetical protein